MKKILSMILAAVLLLGVITPMNANAATVTKPTAEWAEENGWTKVSDYYTKTIDNINYKLLNCWSKYDDLMGNNPSWQIHTTKSPDASGVVTILGSVDGFPVTSVGTDTFNCNMKVTECVIQEGVEVVGNDAFQYCYKLEKVSMPDSLKMIDAGAFYDCPLLTEITVPASVEYVGRTAFKRNNVEGKGLETLTFEGNAPEVLYTGEYVGYSLDGLDGVTVNYYEGTSGWDSEIWTVHNLNKIIEVEEVTGITLDKDSMELEVGETAAVIATVEPEDATDKTVTWTSADESIATVEDGVITGVAEGTTTVTATCGSVSASVIVKVNVVESIEPPVYVEAEKITLDKESVILDKGASVTITATVEPEDATDKTVTWTAEDESIATVENGVIAGVAEGTTTITATCGNASASVEVEIVESVDEPDVTEIFSDVQEGKWYVPYVQYVYDNGLMSGNNGLFNPTDNITRGQLVTTLYRLAGEPEVNNRSALEDFSDVAEGKYYTDAVCWAYSTGVGTGNNGKFNPTASLTRQQMAAFFYRFANNEDLDTTAAGDLSAMKNADKVNSYAVEAVTWAVGAGLISGSEVTDPSGNISYDLAPQEPTTRAQVAAILMRFCESYHL